MKFEQSILKGTKSYFGITVKNGKLSYYDKNGVYVNINTLIPDGFYDSDIFKKGLLANIEECDTPIYQVLDEQGSSNINKNDLQTIVNCFDFCSKDKLRPALTGVLINSKHIVATDAHMLRKHEHTSSVAIDIIIPAPLKPYLSKIKNDICISVSDKYIRVKSDNDDIFAPLNEGKYPNYEAVIPKNNEFEITIDKDELNKAASNCLLTADKESKRGVLSISSTGAVTLSSEDLNRVVSHKETLKVVSYNNSEDINIGINISFLQKIIKSIKKDKSIKISYTSSTRALLINDDYLLMPILLQ